MSISCNCTASSLAPQNVYLGETDEVFQFLSFFGGANLTINQSNLGVVLSATKNPSQVYIGLSEVIDSGVQSYNPLVFNDSSVLGYTNNMYSAGIATVPVNGFYEVNSQVTIIPDQPISPMIFNRNLFVIVNGITVATSSNKTTGDNQIISANVSAMVQLNAGDQIQIALLVGAPGAKYRIIGGASSFLSVRQFS